MSASRNNVKRSNLTACRRCKTRKQRCDQDVPACGNCARAGVECVGVGANGFAEPRSYIKSLEDYIAQLEQQVASSQRTADAAQSGFDKAVNTARLAVPLNTAMHYALSLPVSTQVTIPEHSVLMALSETYFEHSNFFSPILDQTDMPQLANAARPDQSGAADHSRSRFVVLMMLATTVELMQRSKSNLHLPHPGAYRAAAFDTLHEDMESIFTSDLNHLECLLLIVQSLEFASDLPNAWHFVGLATRLAITLNLHTEGSLWLTAANQHADKARKLFWTMYNLERNLCVVLGRPFSIPDTAITTDVPGPSSTWAFSRHAERLIAYRRLESEVHQMTQEAAPRTDVLLNHDQWRVNMRTRLHEWRDSVPSSSTPTKLAPKSFWDGALTNALLRIYLPSKYMPYVTEHDFDELRWIGTETIKFYRQSFRDGELRFFWRTLHFLYLAGEALVHCAKHLHSRLQLDNDSYSDIKESIDSCATVLWSMVERCPKSEGYRDRFDALTSELTELKPISLANMYDMLETTDFDNI